MNLGKEVLRLARIVTIGSLERTEKEDCEKQYLSCTHVL
jgi:hypothetical protein